MAHTKDARALGLTGSDAWVYCALRVLCANQPWNGTMQKLAEESMCGGKDTANRAVARLIDRGIVQKTKDGITLTQNASNETQNASVQTQNASNLRERSKENRNNIKECPSVNNAPMRETDTSGGQTDFDVFWCSIAPTGAENKYRSACERLFNSMPQQWRARATEQAPKREKGRNPYWWLKDEDFLRADGSAAVVAEPHILTNEEQTSYLEAGVPMVVVKYKGRFPVITKADALRFGLKAEREF